MAAIFKKEFKSYFHNMIGPVFMTAVMIFIGLYFFVYNMNYGYPYFAVALSGVSIVFLLLVPVLTMRSFAEEKRSKTDQMLLSVIRNADSSRKIFRYGISPGRLHDNNMHRAYYH